MSAAVQLTRERRCVMCTGPTVEGKAFCSSDCAVACAAGLRVAFTPRKGAERRFECVACGEVVIEKWHGAGPLDFTARTKSGADCEDHGCDGHPAGKRRGYHVWRVEVRS